MSADSSKQVQRWNPAAWWADRMHPAGQRESVEKLTFVVLDTETTGLDPERDRILSIGALRVHQGRIHVKEALELYLQQEHFDSQSVPIHGILREDAHHRVSEAEALRLLSEYIGDAEIVGHHIGFDRAILQRGLSRQGLKPLRNACLDTGLLYQKTLLKTPLLRRKEFYSLDDLARRFDLARTDRHTALGDAYLTAMALLHILGLLKAKGIQTRKQLLRAGRAG